MDRRRTLINVAVVVAIASAVYFLPQGNRAANTFGAVLSVALFAGLAWFAGRMYLEHRLTLHGLGDRHRALLYGALAVGAVDIAAQPRMWQTSLGEVAWFAILGACVYALVVVFRFSRSY